MCNLKFVGDKKGQVPRIEDLSPEGQAKVEQVREELEQGIYPIDKFCKIVVKELVEDECADENNGA